MNKHEEEEKENGERWMLTYCDLITLLLAFFIIMFGISNVDKEKYKAVIESLGSAFGAAKGTAAPGSGAGGEINFPLFSPNTTNMPSVASSAGTSASASGGANASPSPNSSASPSSSPDNGGLGNAIEVEKMNDIKNAVQGMLNKDKLQNDVTVSIRPRGLVISINTRVLFASGSADLTADSKALIVRISNILVPLANNQISVEGHTDDDPISTSQFPSNWYLSSARANTVLQLLLSNGKLKPTNLSSIGYGEFRPIVKNDTPANKAKNRRVNIVILKDDYNKSIDINAQD
jgi:chemotaxis protein MotB